MSLMLELKRTNRAKWDQKCQKLPKRSKWAKKAEKELKSAKSA